eukprot:CAMPEP_0181418798 /NCGR_PEP_ID=MMETSP1110-20121109/11745_1 /TAXON_ID=174948 /ORGANISM="Symbiodinium sp., Strain CCMP421" /LENGTH=822 /DNA_ID=CAMNT_0023541797 /DNA_START=38 /DNA_END=2503 /DNA_ORIENTATION=+
MTLVEKKHVPDIVQFCCQLYFAQEGDSPLIVDIMRLGSLKGRCSVKYHTINASAIAGREYEACSGELIFENGEDQKEISIVINDDDNWSPSTEFKIVLTHPQHCKLGQDLQHCRVKVIDDDAFPGNKHREEILKGEDAIWNISGFSLFMEFFRLNFISEGIGWRTVLTVALDQLKNAYLMLTLAMKTYLINVVLDTSKPTESLIFPDRRLCAIVIGIMYILPLWILHVWDYHKLALDVQGRTKMFIQTTLFRKYLNYSEKSRRSMTPAQMNHAITQESSDVASAYAAVLDIIQMIGRIFLMVVFTLSQDPACWWVVAMMPSLMILFGLLRGDAMSKVTRVSSTVQEAVVAFVSESCDKYSLIAEYSRRPVMSDIFEKKANLARLSVIPEQQVALNNNYFPQWLGPTFIGAYIALFAESVLEGTTSMGVFLAIISVISDMTNDFEGIFIELMSINTRIDSLKVLTHFFNMESELPILRELNLRNRARTKEERSAVLKMPEPPPETGLLRTDLIEMRIENVSFNYRPNQKLLENVGLLHVPLGKIVALVGVHGSGKNTFLRLIASRLLPEKGEIFVPTHLRVLFVAQDPVLLDASVWENLTYGAPDNSDLDVVKGVLRLLNMPNILDILETEVLAQATPTNHPPNSDVEQGIKQPNRSPVEKLSDLGEPLTARDRNSRTLSMTGATGATSYMELPALDPEELAADVAKETSKKLWMEPLTYTEKVKVSLARALIMNPDLLVLHRPFHHFDLATADDVLAVIKAHHANRGACLPVDDKNSRRPRCVVFSPETVEQARQAHILWQIDHIDKTVREVHRQELNSRFE